MKFSRSAALCLSLLAASTHPVVSFAPSRVTAPVSWALSSSSTDKETLGLTDELQKLTDAFANIGDDKLRYKQLLYMASNGLDAMPEELKTDSNKVLGCLSTVHVYATPQPQGDATVIHFQGDSDGLLTKGLVALLVRCVLFIANCWILCCTGNINFALWVGYDVFSRLASRYIPMKQLIEPDYEELLQYFPHPAFSRSSFCLLFSLFLILRRHH